MIIAVKRKHIRKGGRSDPAYCPVSLALTEITGDEWLVTDDYLHHVGTNRNIPVSRSVVRFLYKFDRKGDRRKLKPFTFRLQYP